MKENKKELIKLISKIAVALAVFVFVLINYKELVNIDVREMFRRLRRFCRPYCRFLRYIV